MLQGQLINEYSKRNKKGGITTMYVYELDKKLATADELADYELVQGVYYRETDEGNPIFQSLEDKGNVVILRKSKSYDESGALMDAYKPVSSEEYRIKKAIYKESLGSPVASSTTTAVAERGVKKVSDMTL